MKITRFEHAERFRVVNRTLQVLLFGAACLMAFFLGWKSLPIVDITTDGRYSLTPETTAYLRTLAQPVEIIGSLGLGEETTLGGERLHELQNLTNRYAAITPKLTVRWVDGFRAQSEFGFKDPYRILVRSGEKSVWILPAELYLPQDDVFLGERALTSALWRLANPTQRSVVVITSKDRWQAEGSWGFKRLAEFFATHNVVAQQIEPADLNNPLPRADAYLLLGHSHEVSQEGLAALQRLLNDRSANVLVGIDELANDAMVRFLYFNGLNWRAQRIEETDAKEKTPGGEMILHSLEPHAITDPLIKGGQTVLARGQWWALEGRKSLIDMTVSPLIKSSPTSRGEGTGEKGPFVLMCAVEKRNSDGTASRLIVSGSSHWLSNAYLSYRGNQTLVETTTDWLCGSGNLLSIPPRTRQARQLGLNTAQLWQMGGWIFACSLVLFGAGMIRWIARPK